MLTSDFVTLHTSNCFTQVSEYARCFTVVIGAALFNKLGGRLQPEIGCSLHLNHSRLTLLFNLQGFAFGTRGGLFLLVFVFLLTQQLAGLEQLCDVSSRWFDWPTPCLLAIANLSKQLGF